MSWEQEIQSFEYRDSQNFPAAGGIVFYGSSSIRLWDHIHDDFPGLPIIRRGFGGAHIHEMLAYIPRIVIPYRPAQIVIYLGGNDIAQRKSADYIMDHVRKIIADIHQVCPQARIDFIEIFYHPRFRKFFDVITEVNARLKDFCSRQDHAGFIPVNHALAPAREPDLRYFQEDQIHLSKEGYRVLATAVRPYLRGS